MTTINPYRYAVVVDAARALDCRESIAEPIVQVIAGKHARQWDAQEIATYLAGHFGDQNVSPTFVQGVIDQITTVCGKCGNRSPLRPGDPSIYGRFCDDCISRCHDDDMYGHVCVIDRYAAEAEQAD